MLSGTKPQNKENILDFGNRDYNKFWAMLNKTDFLLKGVEDKNSFVIQEHFKQILTKFELENINGFVM